MQGHTRSCQILTQSAKHLKVAHNFKPELTQQLEDSPWVDYNGNISLKNCVSLFGYLHFLSLHPKTLAENVLFMPSDTLTAFSRQLRDSFDVSFINPLGHYLHRGQITTATASTEKQLTRPFLWSSFSLTLFSCSFLFFLNLLL